jgi:cytochrome c oxidase subunit III
MRPLRVVGDVSDTPDVVFGTRDIMWWGTLGFVVIEGFTLALCAVVYLYLWKNFETWPPQGIPRPSLGVPTLQVAVMLASLPLMSWTSRAARRYEFHRVRLGLTIATLFGIAFCGLRLWEAIVSLHVKWSSNAYGSALWLILGAHFTLLAVELVEIAGMAAMYWFGPVEDKHFSDVADVAFYWYFMVLAWIPLYVLCFWGPRWM